jgi:hypothetical protein
MSDQAHRAVWATLTGLTVDGETRPVPQGFERFTVAALFMGLMRIVCGRGVAVIGPDLAARIGLPVDALPTARDDFKNHGVAVELRSHGFRVSEISRWFHVKHPSVMGPGVWFALGGLVDVDNNPMFGGTPQQVTAALATWDRITGSVWRGGGGDASNAILKRQRVNRGRTEPVWRATAGPRGPEGEKPGTLQLTRHLWMTGMDRPDTVYPLDQARAFLSAATCTKVAAGELTHTRKTAYDKKAAGWYEVALGPWGDFANVLPDPAGYHRVVGPNGGVLLDHPTVGLLDELARDGFYSFDVLDSWTAPATDVLIGWAGELRGYWDQACGIEDDAVRSLVLAGLKACFRQSHGYWRSGQSNVVRYDWAGAMIGMHNANQFRKLWKLWRGPADADPETWWNGPTPVFIETDAVYFPQLVTPDGWTIWDEDEADDRVTKLGHWRRMAPVTKKRRGDVSRETEDSKAA